MKSNIQELNYIQGVPDQSAEVQYKVSKVDM